MIRLADVVADMVQSTPFLLFGMQQRLWNLSQLAAYLRPLIEVRAKKVVSVSAIAMALSRLRKRTRKTRRTREQYRIRSLGVLTALMTATFDMTVGTHRSVTRFVNALQHKHGYITVCEGSSESTIIFSAEYEDLFRACIRHHPKYLRRNLCALRINFDERYSAVPGFIYVILQQLLLQHVNIVEIASTYTELTLFIDHVNLKIAFDTLETLFVRC